MNDRSAKIAGVERRGERTSFWATLVLVVISVLVITGFAYSMWRIRLLTESQDLLFHSLSVKSESMTRAKAREYMKSQGYKLDPASPGNRDYFNLGRGQANKDWVFNRHRAYIEYREGVAFDAGVEVVHGYF